MNTDTISALGSPSELYKARRDAGADHSEALAAVAHAYGRRPKDFEQRLEQVRREWESRESEIIEEPQEITAEPDPFTAAEAEIEKRVAALSGERQRLSLDVLTAPEERQQLAAVEAELTSLSAEVERLALAKLESARREREECEQAEQRIVDEAVQRAGELQADRQKAALRADKYALAFAQALSDHNRICNEQAQTVAAAARPEAWRGCMAPAWVIECAFAHALSAAGAPGGWLDLSSMVHGRQAPLAAIDPRPIEPKSKPSHTTMKEK